MRKVLLKLLLLAMMCFPTTILAATIDFTWVQSTSPNVVSYKLLWSTAQGTCSLWPVAATVGNVSSYSYVAVPPGIYYFALIAVNSSGEESACSTIVTVSFGPRCDINVDGVVNVLDWQLLANIILEIDTCPGPLSCDLNQDGTVNVLDWQLLALCVLGEQTCPY